MTRLNFLSLFLSFSRSLTPSTYSLYVYRATVAPDYTPWHTHTHTRWDSSGQRISPLQRTLPENTQHSRETGIHAAHGNRTHNRSKRAAFDPRRRPRGYWDRAVWTSRVAYHCRWKHLWM